MNRFEADRYDVIVVGARVAGASTAMLLAQRGLRVLLLDRQPPGTDTLSTHALMRAGVLQLKRWGLLEEVIDSGAPAIARTVVHYGDQAEVIDLEERSGVRELFAPRRFVLDAILARAAEAEGVEMRFQTTVTGLLRDETGRVAGVFGRDAEGGSFQARAAFVVGADGLASRVAREVAAPIHHSGSGATGMIYGYWSGLGADRFDWFYRPGLAAGIIPTHGAQACVWVGAPAARFMESLRFDLDRAFDLLLEEAGPPAVERVRGGRREGRLRGFAGLPGFMRQPWGEGWALVGDASHFKDPISAHGMTDALRDAELLAEALASALSGRAREQQALSAYQHLRDRLTLPLFEATDQVASYRWDLERLRTLLIRLSKAMKAEVEAIDELTARRQPTAA